MTGAAEQLSFIIKIRDASHMRAIPDKGIKPVVAFYYTYFAATDLDLFHAVPGEFFRQTDFRLQRRLVINGRIQ